MDTKLVLKEPKMRLVRNEQDLGKEINAQLGALNNALASDSRDDAVISQGTFVTTGTHAPFFT